MAESDAALILCVVPAKSHGVDDRSAGETLDPWLDWLRQNS